MHENYLYTVPRDIYFGIFYAAFWVIPFAYQLFFVSDYDTQHCVVLRSWSGVVVVYSLTIIAFSLSLIACVKKFGLQGRVLSLNNSFRIVQLILETFCVCAIMISMAFKENCGGLRKVCVFYLVIQICLLTLLLCSICGLALIGKPKHDLPHADEYQQQEQAPLLINRSKGSDDQPTQRPKYEGDI